MMREFENTRNVLDIERNRNVDMHRENEHLKKQNKDLDGRVIELTRDNEILRQNFADK